jgi:hypothetical protein
MKTGGFFAAAPVHVAQPTYLVLKAFRSLLPHFYNVFL